MVKQFSVPAGEEFGIAYFLPVRYTERKKEDSQWILNC